MWIVSQKKKKIDVSGLLPATKMNMYRFLFHYLRSKGIFVQDFFQYVTGQKDTS